MCWTGLVWGGEESIHPSPEKGVEVFDLSCELLKAHAKWAMFVPEKEGNPGRARGWRSILL